LLSNFVNGGNPFLADLSEFYKSALPHRKALASKMLNFHRKQQKKQTAQSIAKREAK
jgi:hypothetical protein